MTRAPPLPSSNARVRRVRLGLGLLAVVLVAVGATGITGPLSAEALAAGSSGRGGSWEALAERAYGHRSFTPALKRALKGRYPKRKGRAPLEVPDWRMLLGKLETRDPGLVGHLITAGRAYASLKTSHPCLGGDLARRPSPEVQAAYALVSTELSQARARLESLDGVPSSLSRALERATEESRALLPQVQQARRCDALREDAPAAAFARMGQRLGEAFSAASAW